MEINADNQILERTHIRPGISVAHQLPGIQKAANKIYRIYHCNADIDFHSLADYRNSSFKILI